MPARLLCLAILLLLPGLARGQEPWEPLGACRLATWPEVEAWREWSRHTPPVNHVSWAEEMARYASRRDVWRWLDRLYIAIADDKVLTLADCAFGDDLHYYVYERYDEAGRCHVVNVWRYEDHFYALVMRDSGRIYVVAGLPVWSPDRSRFAYAVCDLLNGTEEMTVMSMVNDRPHVDGTAELPCTLGDCKLAWEGNATVAATCQDQATNRQVIRLTRQGDGWVAKTSNQ